MGKRGRQRQKLAAPTSEYVDDDGNVLELRGSLTPATRRDYAALMAGLGPSSAAATREDVWQRGVEFLFERLAVRWQIAGTEPITRQRELLGRYRFASAPERRWIRDVLREHLAEHFPDLRAP